MSRTLKGGFLSSLKFGTSAMAVAVAMTSFGSGAIAQDTSGDDAVEEVVVTGSRIRRDSFTSAAPLQNLNVEAARQIGITSITDLLHSSKSNSKKDIIMLS